MNVLLSLLMRFSEGSQKWHAAPFSLKAGSTVWSVATDEHVLLAVKMSGAKRGRNYPKEIKNMLTKPAFNFVVVDLKALKEWAGDAPGSLVPSGMVDAEHQAVLLDHIVDRRKLAFLFSKFTVPAVRMWLYGPGIIGFEPEEKKWRAFLATCADKPEGDEPVFKVENLSPAEFVERETS